MYIKIYADREKDQEITKLENWTRPKQKDRHWKDGRSAKELAKYMTVNLPGIPSQLEDLLVKKFNCSLDTTFTAIPECVTYLPGKGEGRNHDMLLWADEHDIVIGLEAKVDEALGDLISRKKFESQNSKDRLMRMYNSIFETDYDFETVRTQALMYQLLSATYGTLKEVKDIKGKGNGVLLVLTFMNGEVANDKMLSTRKAISDFRTQLKSFYQLNGSYRFSNYPDINFWIEEIYVE